MNGGGDVSASAMWANMSRREWCGASRPPCTPLAELSSIAVPTIIGAADRCSWPGDGPCRVRVGEGEGREE